MKLSVLVQGDLDTLREIGSKLKSGTEWERTVGDFILEYTKDRIPTSKDDKREAHVLG